MKNRAWLLLGLRYLFGKRDRKGSRQLRGAVLAIGFSLIPLIVVLVVSDGMIEGITARYIEMSTYHLQSLSFRSNQSVRFDMIAEEIGRIDGVTVAFAERQGIGLLSSGKGRSGVTVRAVPPDLYSRDAGFRQYLYFHEGAFDLSDPNNILIGSGVAKDLGVKTGDRLTVVTMRSIPGRPMVPRLETFLVRGVFSTGYQELDSLWVYIPLDKGRIILDSSTAQEIIGIKALKPFDDLEHLRSEIEKVLPVDFRTYTWYDLEKSQYKSFQTTRILLLFIMALIVCVAAVNISSSLVMLVIEKRQEIGILKSIGASPSGIENVFLTTGFLVGVMGTAIGMTAGLLTAININGIINTIEKILNSSAALIRIIASPFAEIGYTEIRILNPAFYLEKIPVHPDVVSLSVIGIFTICASAFASYFPARSAGRTRPLDVLRKH